MLRYIILILLLLSNICLAEEFINLEADKVTSYDNNTVFANGNVLVTYKNMILTADNLTYYKDKNLAEGFGNIVFQDENNYLTASHIKINLDTNVGLIEDGKGFYAPYTYFSADKIEKIGKDSYLLDKAKITSCNQEHPDWYFYSRSARIDYGEYIKAKHTSFNIAGVPALYTPYFVWPIKKKRESGFLIPDIGYKTDAGFFVTPKYFVDLGINKDMTLGINYLAFKGPMANAEFRYAKSVNENIYMYGEFIDDKNSKSNKSTRWRFVNKSNLYLADNLELKMNIDYVSDFKYKEDFDEFVVKNDKIETNSEENYSVNEIRLNYKLSLADISLRYLDNMHYYKNSDGFTKNHLTRKPNVIIEKSNLSLKYLQLDYLFDYNKILYNNYYYFVDASDFSDKISYGRYFGKIKLYKPVDLVLATFTPFFIQTVAYWRDIENVDTDKDDDNENSVLTIDYDGNAVYRKIYSFGAKLSLNEFYKDYKLFRHSIYNTFEYRQTPYINQAGLPDLIENDRIDEENFYSYTLTNYLKGSNWSLKIELNQVYNIALDDERFEPINIKSDFKYGDLFKIYLENSYDYYEKETAYFKNSYVANIKNLFFSTEYVFDKNLTEYNSTLKYDVKFTSKKIDIDVYEKFSADKTSVNFSGLKKQELAVKTIYKSDCWNLGILLKENYYDIVEENSVTNKTDRTVFLVLELKGLGKTEKKIFNSK